MGVGSTAFILVPEYWKVRKPNDLPRVTQCIIKDLNSGLVTQTFPKKSSFDFMLLVSEKQTNY